MDESVDLDKFLKCDIFTPDDISKFMTSKLKTNGNLLEPSVGTGNLLKYIDIKNYTNIDIYEIKEEYLNKINNVYYNKYLQDFLKSDLIRNYDNIIMNPPYIRTRDLSIEYRNFIKNNFPELKSGLVDIYYAFILKCIKILKNEGIMVSITPNTYLYNKSALNLRKYLFQNKYIKEIIDFKDKKVFKDASVYCCITIFTKENKDFLIYNDKNILYTDINTNYSLFNNIDDQNTKLKNICKISNGIATLRDKIYIKSEKLYNEPCWVLITNGNKEEYIIYPYENGKIILENEFQKQNPQTYQYLIENKEELLKRDKGKKKYPTWYAYGRSQSILPPTKKSIYIPCFINPSKFKDYIYIKNPMLYKSCLCIEPNNEEDINLIINSILQNISFIINNSSKKSGGWININSTILYSIPILNN